MYRRVFKRRSSKQDLWRLASKRSWSPLLSILETDPDARRQASTTDFSGHYLLHTVLAYDPPVKVAQELAEVCPKALISGGLSETLPIHVAAMYGASAAVVEVLWRANPESLMTRDGRGNTSLHIAVRRACELHDECTSDDDDRSSSERRENTARHGEALAVVSTLCRLCPSAITQPDESGELPFDTAVFLGGHKGPVAAVLEDAARQRAAASVRRLSSSSDSSANPHDMKQLKELMEWTRQRSQNRMSGVYHSPLGPNISRPPAA